MCIRDRLLTGWSILTLNNPIFSSSWWDGMLKIIIVFLCQFSMKSSKKKIEKELDNSTVKWQLFKNRIICCHSIVHTSCLEQIVLLTSKTRTIKVALIFCIPGQKHTTFKTKYLPVTPISETPLNTWFQIDQFDQSKLWYYWLNTLTEMIDWINKISIHTDSLLLKNC